MDSHPLYNNSKKKKPKSKSKKRKNDRLKLIKNQERDKLKEEIEIEKLQRFDTFGDEQPNIQSKQLEAKDDEINKLKSENDVLNITIKHLHEILKEKQMLNISQQREIISLNQKINQLSFENTQLRAQNSLITRKSHFEQNFQPSQEAHSPREETKEEYFENAEKLRLIEETEILLNRSKADTHLNNDYLEDLIHSREDNQYQEDSAGFSHKRTDSHNVDRDEPIVIEEQLENDGTISLDSEQI
jgi:hypothetical protein